MMVRRFSPAILSLQFVADLLLTLLAVKLAEQARLHIVTGLERREQFVTIRPWVFLLVMIMWIVFLLLFGAFDARRRRSLVADLGSLWLSITVSMLVLASLFYLMALQPPDAPSRLFYMYLYLIDLLLLGSAHMILFLTLRLLHGRGRHLRRVLLVGAGVRGRHVAVRLRNRQTSGLMLVGYLGTADDPPVPGLALLGSPADVRRVVEERRIQEVVVALPAEAHVEAFRMTAQLEGTDVDLRILPDVFELAAMRATIEDFYGLPLISIREPSIGPIQARVKRAFDLLVSLLLLLVLSPVCLAIAIWIRLDSPGPILLHQQRVGAEGVPFSMHKFRTMYWRPGEEQARTDKRPNDPRVTRAGRFLRRTSLDELPQLWNVVRGEMSLVGPRPELPAIVELYEPWQRKRFHVPPGMTGWWQVNGRANRSMHLNTEIDLYYVQNYSILLDLQILARTLGAVIRGRGAF